VPIQHSRPFFSVYNWESGCGGSLPKEVVFSDPFSLSSSQRGLAKPSAKPARAALARRIQLTVIRAVLFFLAPPATASDAVFDGLVFQPRSITAEWLALTGGCGKELLARISHPMHGQVVEVHPVRTGRRNVISTVPFQPSPTVKPLKMAVLHSASHAKHIAPRLCLPAFHGAGVFS